MKRPALKLPLEVGRFAFWGRSESPVRLDGRPRQPPDGKLR